MFTIKSFRNDGSRIESVNEAVGFVGLYFNGKLVEYFNTVQAAKYTAETIELHLNAKADTTVTFCVPEFKQAA